MKSLFEKMDSQKEDLFQYLGEIVSPKTLQLKQIAPYLPYNLKSADLCVAQYGLTSPLISDVVASNIIKFTDNTSNAKPILRPLSDLSELMPQKGVSYTSYLWYQIIATDNDSFDKDEFYENCELGLIQFLPIMVYEQLLEWHFDVFSLIKKGLAIDINTLSANGS